MAGQKTIHTSRTMMLKELSQIMSFGLSNNSLSQLIEENVIGKLTRSNQVKTNRYLIQLYGFDDSDPGFKAFRWFWDSVSVAEHPVMALLYAIKNDYLLAESIEAVLATTIGNKVSVEEVRNNLRSQHPNKFSDATSLSLAQNITSSWKQAGFIHGKVKNIRTQPVISYWHVTFAITLGYLEGLRGDFLLGSKYVRSLGISEGSVRELLLEAAKRDLLQYQFTGHITVIILNHLLKRIGIDGDQN